MGFDDLTQADWVAIVGYGSVALYVSCMVPRLFRGRMIAGLVSLALWSTLLGIILVGYSYRSDVGDIGRRVMANVFPGTALETAPKEVTVFRRPQGEFIVSGSVGKTRMSFVLDTGASTVVLRAEDAVRVGIAVKSLTYDVPVSTANGHALTAAVTLPELRIGGIREGGVEALVARQGALHENLLGMSFLDRLERFTFSNDKLVLRGR